MEEKSQAMCRIVRIIKSLLYYAMCLHPDHSGDEMTSKMKIMVAPRS